ncbi:MAG: hypothetical protein ABI900_02645 [Betaproteobacteria bacterium]
MASARELLEQADALMRRNRNRNRNGGDIPVLTDVVAGAPANDESESDVPVLTDAIDVGAAVAADSQHAEAQIQPIEPGSGEAGLEEGERAPASPQASSAAIMRSVEAIPVELPMDGDMSDWLVMDTIDPSTHSITGAGPDTLAVIPPVTLKAAAPEPTPPPETAAPASAVDDAAERAARAAAEEERWRALAEQMSMQVLQRVDLFTDTGLKTQLALHLQPIVERASAELVKTITDHVGGVLRAYVAEAIEREIAQWRRDH